MDKVIKENYVSNLKSLEYCRKLNKMMKDDPTNFHFYLTFLHEVFSSGLCKGRKLFEIGSGPTIYNVTLASAYFSNIVLSDLVPDNCEEIRRWLNEQSSLDWSQFFDFISQLEGHTGDKLTSRQELESRTRKAVKCVLEFDLLCDFETQLSVLDSEEVKPPYDTVSAICCLEGICPDFEAFVDSLRKINEILRPGGTLVVCSYTNRSVWCLDDKSFNYLHLTLEEVLDAMNRANFRLKYLTVRSVSQQIASENILAYCSVFEKI
ncbi:nicotinamide N-methyltransferase-like isoform X2 [Stegodyphus dumicola]|uniref:nicotinamide N-methyltransferase-like isoform X2 n=1 Tax=Stegodyphus dumicola TaxID=202533 RepID=UPI0015AC5F53|nr:nicotinamide N-methyltransferase-like isoform X2 [Stegodyphus dumicola]